MGPSRDCNIMVKREFFCSIMSPSIPAPQLATWSRGQEHLALLLCEMTCLRTGADLLVCEMTCLRTGADLLVWGHKGSMWLAVLPSQDSGSKYQYLRLISSFRASLR